MCSSVPLFKSPTLGCFTPRPTVEYALPISANWQSIEGLHSALAPQSHSTTILPLTLGTAGVRAGRFMPRNLPRMSCPPTMVAPVEPAVTSAATSSCFLSIQNACMSEEFFFLTASVGMSFMSMTSGQSTISSLSAG